MISKQSVLCSLLLLVGLSVEAARAQTPLEADAVAYRGKDSSSGIIKVYYGVIERALAFKQNGANWNANISARAEVWQNGKAIATKDIRDTIRHAGTQKDVEALGANKILGAVAFTAPYQSQTIAAFLWQRGMKDGKAIFDTIAIPISMPDRDAAHVALGGIELASSADKPTGTPSPFEEAGVVLMPNPSAVFGDNYTKLYYYTELYVPKAMQDPSNVAEIITSVIDGTGREVLTSTTKHEMFGDAIPVVGAIDIDGLAGDSYKLRVRVKHEDGVIAESEKPFFFTSEMKISEEAPAPAAVDENALFAASELSKLTDAEADERIAQTLYRGTDADRKATKALKDVATKQSFLYTFWRKKDAEEHAAHPLDSYRSFLQRVDSANKMYTHMKTPGWKTGRGRVFIVYGLPRYLDETHRVATESKPYITWQYEEGDPRFRLMYGAQQAEFDFLDRQGGGDYVLVHSNVVGETYEPDWYSREALRLAH